MPASAQGVQLLSLSVPVEEAPPAFLASASGNPPEATEISPSRVALDSAQIEILRTALQAAQTRMNVALHNMANASTVGFKRSRVLLTDLSYRTLVPSGAEDRLGNLASSGVSLGSGVKVQAVQLDMSPGQLTTTGRPLDVAIEGEGFFQVTDPSGEILYTRCGSWALNNNHQLCLCSAGVSRLVEPDVSIPNNATNTTISENGVVAVTIAGGTEQSRVGCIQTARFGNSEGLRPVGDGLFAQTQASGPPMGYDPGTNANGKLRQRMLEASNVNAASERAEWTAATEALEFLQSMQTSEAKSEQK